MFKEDQSLKYSINIKEFEKEGISYRHVESMDGKPFFYKTKLFSKTFISGGKETLEKIKKIGDNEKTLEDEYPHYLYLKDAFNDFPLLDGYEIKDIEPEDHKAIQEFIDLNTPEDIDEAEIYLDDPDEKIKMIYFQGKPVVYAAYRRFKKNSGDVGILVHPDHRKKGLGVYAVNEITKLAVKNSVLPMYRTWIENKGSMGIAQKCGYDNFWNINEYKLNM